MSPPDTLHQLSITAQLATPVCHALPLHMFCYFLPWASDVTTPMALHMLVPQTASFSPFLPLHHLCAASTSLISTSFYNWCCCVSFTTTFAPSPARSLVCLYSTHPTDCLSPLNCNNILSCLATSHDLLLLTMG